MKKTIFLFAIAFLMQSLNANAQCCSAHAGPAKTYCRDSVQIGGSPADSVSCGRGCTAVSLTWSPSTGLSNPNVANPWAYPTSTTVYTLQVVVTNFITHAVCCTSISTTTVTYAPRCIADAGTPKTICCSNTTVTIGGSPAGIDSCTSCDSLLYNWTPATGLSNPNVANPMAHPSVTTTYTLTVSAINISTRDTCCSSKSTVKVTVNSSCCRLAEGIQSINANPNFKIYPNPTNQNFNIEIGQPLINGNAMLYDLNGRIIWKTNSLKGNETIQTNINDIQKGIYFIEVTDGDKKVFRDKIIIQ